MATDFYLKKLNKWQVTTVENGNKTGGCWMQVGIGLKPIFQSVVVCL